MHMQNIRTPGGGVMTGRYDVAAQLANLAASIDEQLGDETADRQWIAESAAARIRDIAFASLGDPELNRREATGVTGPFETEQQVRELPAVRAVYDAFDAAPGVGRMAPHNKRLLEDACADAGVAVGAYDRRILAWLAGWEPQMCAVVAGLIERARQAAAPRVVLTAGERCAECIGLGCDCGEYCHGGEHAHGQGRHRVVLTATQSDCLADMLADAVDARICGVAGDCTDCDADPSGLCWDHSADLGRVEAYKALAADLGVVPS